MVAANGPLQASWHRHGFYKDAARGFTERLLLAAGGFPSITIAFGSRLKGRASQPFLSIQLMKEKQKILSFAKKVTDIF